MVWLSLVRGVEREADHQPERIVGEVTGRRRDFVNPEHLAGFVDDLGLSCHGLPLRAERHDEPVLGIRDERVKGHGGANGPPEDLLGGAAHRAGRADILELQGARQLLIERLPLGRLGDREKREGTKEEDRSLQDCATIDVAPAAPQEAFDRAHTNFLACASALGARLSL